MHRLLILVGGLVALALAASPIVKTSSGELEGVNVGPINKFLGVPYASAPVGPLRWKRPQPPPTWSSVRQAVAFQNSCMQASIQSIPQSEDCLYLNIFAPVNASKLPVMYWIHGGGWEFGSPNWSDGTNLSAWYNVIYVTVTYRLGALGYLAEPHLLEQEPYLGALGIMDQQAGLQWVQKNIAAFGGDPGRVTIFGESAGGGSVGLQLTIPSSKGLFRNAISESGVWFYPTLADWVPQSLLLSTTLGCAAAVNTYSCLMNQSASDIMLALPVDGDIILGFRNDSFGVHWYPCIDGDFIVGQPINVALKGGVHANAVMFGTNGQEGAGFVIPYLQYQQISQPEFEFFVNNSWGGEYLTAAYSTYATDVAANNYTTALSDMANDFWFQCQRFLFAGATAANKITTYTYLFSYPYTAPGQPNIGATHADEVAFVWDQGIAFNTSEAQLAKWMSSAWAAFATSDDPNGAMLPVTWPAHNKTSEQPINFNLQLSVLPGPYRLEYCAMWNPTLLLGGWPDSFKRRPHSTA